MDIISPLEFLVQLMANFNFSTSILHSKKTSKLFTLKKKIRVAFNIYFYEYENGRFFLIHFFIAETSKNNNQDTPSPLKC